MNKLKLGVVFFVLFTFLSGTVVAQITSSEVDELVEDAMQKFDVAGVAVGIVKDGKVIHTKGYGVKSIETKQKVNEHTNFAIASNSKAFTTAALAILVEEGKLSWTDKVKKHIPEFTMYNAYVTENFNIQDLLTHRSGLGLGAGDLMLFPGGSYFTIDDILTGFQYFEPQSAFRTKFDYDNLLYIVAGEVIKRVSGMTWEKFVATRIHQPLKMDNTFSTFSLIDDKSNVATPHSTETGPLTALHKTSKMQELNGAAGGIYSNVDDLCNWMLVHLNEGKYSEDLNKHLFSEESQQEMWQIQTNLNVNKNPRYNSHFRGYGLGWFLEDVNGNLSVSHTGGLAGMLSKTILIPDLELGVVVLTNTSNGGAGVFSAVTQTIVDSYLGLDDFNWTDKTYKKYSSMKNVGDSVFNEVWEVVKEVDKIEIFLKDGQLWFKSYRSPKLNGPMYFYKANTFAIKWEYRNMNADAFAMFSLDEEGVAQSIKMKGISPNIDFSFDFQDLDLKRVEK